MVRNILTPSHLIVVLAVVLLVLGPRRVPAADRGLGAGIQGLKETVSPGRGQAADRRPFHERADTQT